MNDAVEMALWLKRWGYSPEQVQDFYPTPGTISTVMYYTGIDPMTGKQVNVTTDYREKQLQRALLQFSRPENANLVREALHRAGREELIGYGEECLVRPAFGQGRAPQRGRKLTDGKKNERDRKSVNSRKSTAVRSRTQMNKNASAPKKSKHEKTFGTDALRIRREADKMISGNKKGTQKHKRG